MQKIIESIELQIKDLQGKEKIYGKIIKTALHELHKTNPSLAIALQGVYDETKEKLSGVA